MQLLKITDAAFGTLITDLVGDIIVIVSKDEKQELSTFLVSSVGEHESSHPSLKVLKSKFVSDTGGETPNVFASDRSQVKNIVLPQTTFFKKSGSSPKSEFVASNFQ